METEVLKEQHYVEELVEIIRSGLPKEELIDRLSDYHDSFPPAFRIFMIFCLFFIPFPVLL